MISQIKNLWQQNTIFLFLFNLLVISNDFFFSDRDKPNTANSEVTYSIIGGNEQRKFSVEATSSKKAVIVLRKDLDYDSGDKLFNLTIRAEVRKMIHIN